MQPLYLLCGLLCDETIWADVPARLADVADVHVASFAGFSSISAMADRILETAPRRLWPALEAMVERATPASFAAQINALLLRADARPVLSSITVPTLVLTGSNDTWSSVSQQAEMQRSVPHAMLVEIAGAGHMAAVERPDAVARALKAWLASV
jgi:pimeloyl-ACP methyl ester carboxylesterase